VRILSADDLSPELMEKSGVAKSEVFFLCEKKRGGG
jgi:hypothetical protein